MKPLRFKSSTRIKFMHEKKPGKLNRKFLVDSLHIFILFNIAFSRPLYVLSRNPEFFIAHKLGPLEVVFLTLVVSVICPALLVMSEFVVGIFSLRLQRIQHFLIVTCLLSVTVMSIFRHATWLPGLIMVTGSVLLGLLITVLYVRFNPIRNLVTFFIPLIFLFPYLFLFESPVNKLLSSPGEYQPPVYDKISDTPVVLVVFDELPLSSLMDKRRSIDSVRYPSFASLAEDSHWFRNATTVSDQTNYALPAILSGLYPGKNRIPIFRDYPENLFTLLGSSHELRVYEPVTKLCPEELCGKDSPQSPSSEETSPLLHDIALVYLHVLFPEDLTAALPSVTQSWKNFSGRRFDQKAFQKLGADRGAAFREFIRTVSASDRPSLYFIHSYLPHLPWSYLPSGKRYSLSSETKGLRNEWWSDNEIFPVQSFQRHLLQTGFVDRLLGELLHELKKHNLYERALIIVTADHGVSFRSGESRRFITKNNFQDILQVPLFIKTPFQKEGSVSDRNAELIDVLPTMADILDIELQWSTDGQSLFENSRFERQEKTAYRMGAGKKFIFDRDFQSKYIMLEQKLALFGQGSDPLDLYKVTPFKDIVGKHVDEIGISGESPVKVSLENESLFNSIDLKYSFIPAHVTGSVISAGQHREKYSLAIALNGVIGAVTQTYSTEGSVNTLAQSLSEISFSTFLKNLYHILDLGTSEWSLNTSESDEETPLRFSAILPESIFRQGKNVIEVFTVKRQNGVTNLFAARREFQSSYRLEEGRLIQSSDNSPVPIVQNAMQGFLDAAEIRGGNVSLHGWAADTNDVQPPIAIIIFVNWEFIYSGSMNTKRDDVAEIYGEQLLMSGFSYVLPVDLFVKETDMEVRIFSLSEKGVASELLYPQGYQWAGKGR
jgi:hypothetical protein